MTTTTTYRIASRPMTPADCHNGHVSKLWDDCCDDANSAKRSGLSCCASVEDLLDYFASGASLGRGAIFEGAYLVTMTGTPSEDTPYEAQYGERLIHPSEVLSCEPVTATFLPALVALYTDRLCVGDNASDIVVYDAEHDEIVIRECCDLCEGDGHYHDEGECIECEDCAGSGVRP